MTRRPSQRLPLTGAQTGVWYGQRLAPESPVYNVGQYVEIDGPVDLELLVRAMRLAASESEALNVRFEEGEDGEPYQLTGGGPAVLPPTVRIVDHTREDDPHASALARMRADMDTPADPATEALYSFALHLVAPDRVLWYQRAHHIALDAYSFSLLSRRTAEIHTALVGGEEPGPTPFGSLGTVVTEERAYRASERFTEDRAYWLERLAGRPEPETLSGAVHPASHAFLRDGATLDPAATAGLLAIARAARASWADVVTAAFAAYLHRSTGSRDVLLSLPTMARLGSAALKVPAMVVNVLPLRVAVRPGVPLAELVAEVAGHIRELRAHQRYRAEDIRRDLGLVGREQGLLGPMVNVKAFDNALDFAGAPGTVHNVAAGPVDDITLGLYHDTAEGRIRFEFDGNPRAYDAAALAARRAEFARFLTEAAVAGPRVPVGRVDLVSADTRRTLLHDPNATAHETTATTVVDAFEEKARDNPGAVAVIAGDTTLTYAELDARASGLARLLIDRGVGPESIVGLALPRSADLLVALHAVLKAGGAYLPLDLDYPADRLEFMVTDARPVCTLTTLAVREGAPDVPGVETIVLDAPDTLAALADASPDTPADTDRRAPLDGRHPAYVIYTSGSTGRPKGVVVPHAALSNFLQMQAHELALTPGDRLLAVTTVSFDIAALEIHTPLVSGATVVLADRDTVRDPAALAAMVDAHRPAVVQATPSLWHALLEDGRPGALGEVRALVGGEALPADLAERLARATRRVTNAYGPTEVTIWATSVTLAPDHTGVPDIGTPFWNTRAYVLDGALRPSPAGRPGELYLAGEQLARGYLGRYALTAERFVADPYGAPGARMYRTGDLVRRRPDGRIDFLGRADDQVKVRGFRIELGEIESALGSPEGVGRAVVVVREDLPGSRHLVGYVTPSGQGTVPGPAALRDVVAARLPEYMVPSAVVVLDAFPLTANGKIDRRSLPAPDLSGQLSGGARAPRGAREEILSGIFADVLGLAAVGPDDDFFSLGGHSLLAARVVARIRALLGTDCGVRDVFEARTVAALAAGLAGRSSAERPALTAAAGRPELPPLSYAQQRLWFLHQLEGPSATYNIPFVVRFDAVPGADGLDLAALDAALGDVVARHETLRTVFGERGGEPYQRVLSPAEAAVRLRVREVPAERFDAEAETALGHHFDLSAEAPLRVTVLRDPETGAHALVVLLHHIASDEWSMGPFLRGLERAYTARRAGEEPQLGELPLQYVDFTLWQRDLLGDGSDPMSLTSRQLAYWNEALAGMPEEQPLPTDRPRPAVLSNAGGMVHREVPAELAVGVRRLARESGTSVFMVVHAAVAALLHRLGAGDDIPLGTPVAGRGDSALDELVGFFVNTAVLRTDLSGGPTFTELLERVRAADLAALDHADLPFDRVVEALNPERSPSRHPLFRTMVSHSTVTQDIRTLFGLPTRVDRIDPGVTKFDLDFTFSDTAHGDELDLELFHSSDLFDRATAELLAERLLRVLEQAVADPARPVAGIELLDGAERALLADWNDTDRPVPPATVVDVLAERVAATPEAVAVVAAGTELTFAQLDERANRLARLLTGLGVGPDRFVALAVPRSADSVVAMFAVLKAGGAFLPLDLDHPAERLEFMLADSAPVCVVTSERVAAEVPELPGVARLSLDAPETAALLAAQPPTAPTTGAAGPGDAAYVIYTSGSTGRPKGVVLHHDGLTHLYRDHERELYTPFADRLGRRVRALHTASFSFDSSWEQVLWLVAGHELHILDEYERRDADAVVAYCRTHRIDTLDVTPSYGRQLIDAGLLDTGGRAHGPGDGQGDGQAGGWRPGLFLLGGEAVLPALWAELRAITDVEVVNYYGPTEFTVDALVARVCDCPTPVVGRPLDNSRAHILDARLRPVPPGVPGELYLSGAQNARGYLGRHALTAERFVADPFGTPGGRMYRTGDLARRRRDGLIEFLGRADDQVKIRGFRVELGEVEAALAALAGVTAAAVIVREDTPGVPRLVGYVTGSAEPATLRGELAASLPEYMVPAAVVVLDTLPTNVNGKLDRAALPAPAVTAAEPSRAPSGDGEERVARIFSEVLGAGPVGADDDFFALGGHSLLATRLVARVRATGTACSVRDVFEARTVAALAARLAQRSTAERPALTAAAGRPELPPLSHAQQRLWFLHRMEGPSATYNIPLAVRLRGEVDVTALKSAVLDVVTRHEALRTVFEERGGEPYQRVLSPAGTRVPFAVRKVPAGRLVEEGEALVSEVIDLAVDVPLRVTLLSAGDEHLLVVLLHHIAGDEWSTGPLLADLDLAYTARAAGRTPEFTPLPVQYADYALWQRELLGGTDDPGSLAHRQAAYWREALSGVPEEPALPTDRPRPATPSHAGGTVETELPAALVAGLERVARESGATMFMVVHAAVAALLHRLGAGDDIPLGSPVAGRGDEALDGLVGFFVNTLVLRADLSGNPTFAELLERVRATDLAGLDHADLPFDAVVEAVNPERSLARHPLFQTMVAYEGGGPDLTRLFGTAAEEVSFASGAAKFDLEILFRRVAGGRTGVEGTESTADSAGAAGAAGAESTASAAGGTAGTAGTGMVCGVRYAKDLFDRASVETLSGRLLRLLEAVAGDPDVPVAAIDVVDSDERERMLYGWNDTARELDGPVNLADLVAAGAAHAQGPALVFEDDELSRDTFDDHVNRLTRLLITRGIGPESIVAVALPRSHNLLIAIHAVIRAGAAYLPLDLTLPHDRLTYMADTAQPVCVLTDLESLNALPDDLNGADPVVLDSPGTQAELAGLPGNTVTDDERTTPLHPHHPAYLIFTSGSTGRPKGVLTEHHAIVNRIQWMQHTYTLHPHERLLHKTPTTFDVSVWELFWPLTQGATLIIAKPDGHKDPHYLTHLIRHQHINITHFVPSMLAAFLNETHLHTLPTLRLIACSGEALPTELTHRTHTSAHPHTLTLTNLYGPTEATIDVTATTCHPTNTTDNPQNTATTETNNATTIGTPVWNTQTYILDPHLQPTPTGTPGELYLAGHQLARGYTNHPTLTAERFTANPYGPPGTRMYRTGDLARHNPDGTIHYLGRTDDQIKLRGFRIEPGEIQNTLTNTPDVAQAAVLVREDRPGVRQLVGYAVPAPGAVLDAEALRRRAAERLPEYMVPAVIVILDALPVTANGKLDRRALPAPDVTTGSGVSRAPRDAREEILAGIWAEMLELDTVGVEDDFFALGGHSLLAARAVGRVRAALGVECGIRDVFEARTVAALAARLAQRSTAGRPALTAAAERPEPLPLSYAQRRLWLIDSARGAGTTYNVPLAVRLSGAVDVSALEAAVRDVVTRHEALRTVFGERDGEPYQRVLAPGEARVPFSAVRVPAARLGDEAVAAGGHVFDLATDVPLRVTLLSAEDDEQVHVLVLLLHHIATDEWSAGPLLADLDLAYTARAAGRTPEFTPLPVQYADYALWQRELLGDTDDPESLAHRQAAYWRDALAGSPDELTLPTDRPRPAVPSHGGDVVTFEVPAATGEGLARIARESGATMFMVVHAAVAALLHRLGAGDDIPLGSPVSGREDEALDGLVGFFLNTLVLRADLSGNPTFAELVARVRDTGLAAFSHAELPLESVVKAVGPARSQSRNPLFQTMVTYHSVSGEVRELFGLPAEELTVEIGGSKVDLEVAFGGSEESGRISGGIRFATDLFDRASVETLSGRLLRLLDAVAEDPSRPVTGIPVMDAEEYERIVSGWNDTARELEGPVNLADLVAAGAAHAQGPALVFEDDELSRDTFDDHVNRLTRLLITRGIGPESIVAVALPRSHNLLIAIHAVIRAGAAYLPLDLTLPHDRLTYMADTAQPHAVLTDTLSTDTLPHQITTERIVLDSPETQSELAGLPGNTVTDDERTTPLHPHHPAYLIFTSGSTGRPKGVLTEHHAIVNRIQWMQHTYTLHPHERLLHKTPTTFDVSVWELFWPLTQGATLIIAKPDGHKDPHYLTHLIRHQHINITHFVPSMLAAFLNETHLHTLPTLRLIACSGEALPTELTHRTHTSAHPHTLTLTNLYGPTEATIDVTATTCHPTNTTETNTTNSQNNNTATTIGTPVWNTQTYILDPHLQPTPTGTPGELYLAGHQLARGYTNHPTLTAERFTANPYGPPGTRMYRTGDLARHNPDGTIHYLGRTDDQIKLRGFRIEPGEIQNTLTNTPDVASAVVVVREDQPGVRRLVAYVVPAPGAVIDRDALRRLAAERLPEYMVPAVFVELDRVPLSPNGKLDRKALPAPKQPAPKLPGARTAAVPADGTPVASGASPVEILSGLVAEVLGLAAVGPDDNFFELGGDSIVSIRLVSQARKAGLTITARQIFQEPTPAGLASVAKMTGAAGTAGASRPAPADGVGPLPLPPIAHWFAGRGGPFARFAQARLVRLPAGTRREHLVSALQTVFDHHDGLRQILTVAGPGVWSAEVRARGALDAGAVLRTADAAGLSGGALRALVAEESDRAAGSLDPVAGRTVAAVQLDAGPDAPGRLLLVAHHLVVDEVSWQIVLPDLRAAWEAVAAGRAPALDPVPTPLRTWTTHLLAESHHARRLAELDHWLSADTRERLLADCALDPAKDTAATARHLTVQLSTERTEPLLNTVPAAFHGTVNDTLLTALALAVGDWAGRAGRGDGGLSLELEGHGREQELLPGADLTRTVGWLTSLYPLRLAAGAFDAAAVLAGREDAGGALKAVKELLRAVPDGGVGAGLLRYVNAATARLFDPAARPEILWNYLGRHAVTAASDWGPADEADALAVRPDPATPLSHALEINAEIENGPDGPRLTATFIWAGEAIAQDVVGELADGWLAALDTLSAWADGGASGGHTPSDLDLLDLDQDQITMLEEMWRAQQ